jgi:hypothetical protein
MQKVMLGLTISTKRKPTVAMTQKQKYERDAELVLNLLKARTDWERDYDCCTMTGLVVGAVCLRPVDNYLHWGTRRDMKVPIEKAHSCRMVLLFCAQRELARVTSVVLGHLEASAFVIRGWI